MSVFSAFMHPRGYGGKFVAGGGGTAAKKAPKPKAAAKPKKVPAVKVPKTKTTTVKAAKVPVGTPIKTPTSGKTVTAINAAGGFGSALKGGKGSASSATLKNEQALAANAQTGAVSFLSQNPSEH